MLLWQSLPPLSRNGTESHDHGARCSNYEALREKPNIWRHLRENDSPANTAIHRTLVSRCLQMSPFEAAIRGCALDCAELCWCYQDSRPHLVRFSSCRPSFHAEKGLSCANEERGKVWQSENKRKRRYTKPRYKASFCHKMKLNFDDAVWDFVSGTSGRHQQHDAFLQDALCAAHSWGESGQAATCLQMWREGKCFF